MDKLNLRILSPRKIIFQGEIISLSSTNSAGKFDVLKGHANFVTLIENFPILVRLPKNKVITYQFPLAVLFVNKNNINIYTDIEFTSSPS